MLPAGRVLYIWRLTRCENGNLTEIIRKCHLCGISGLVIKAGDQGKPWAQFSKILVDRLHAAGIRVYGWSYDVPDKIQDQFAVAQRVHDLGADGFLVDAETEWDNDPDADAHAAEYAGLLATLAGPNFSILDAPWDVVKFHRSFPFTAFSSCMAARCPQNYHVAHGMSARRSWDRFVASWAKYGAQRPAAVRPLIPSLSTWGTVTTDDIRLLERLAFEAGCPGVLHWVWDSVPDAIWAGWASGSIPTFGDIADA